MIEITVGHLGALELRSWDKLRRWHLAKRLCWQAYDAGQWAAWTHYDEVMRKNAES